MVLFYPGNRACGAIASSPFCAGLYTVFVLISCRSFLDGTSFHRRFPVPLPCQYAKCLLACECLLLPPPTMMHLLRNTAFLNSWSATNTNESLCFGSGNVSIRVFPSASSLRRASYVPLDLEQMVSPVFRNRCLRNRSSHPSSALQTTRQDRPSQTPCLRRRQLDTVTNLHQAGSTHAMFTPGTRKSRADKSGRTCKSMRHTRGISSPRDQMLYCCPSVRRNAELAIETTYIPSAESKWHQNIFPTHK